MDELFAGHLVHELKNCVNLLSKFFNFDSDGSRLWLSEKPPSDLTPDEAEDFIGMTFLVCFDIKE